MPPVYLEEPTLPLEWAMETPACGTLILPFDAELPEGLEAYSMVNIKRNKSVVAIDSPEHITAGSNALCLQQTGEYLSVGHI